MLPTPTQQQISLIFCTLVVLFTSNELYHGRLNLHLHDQVHRTHQISTVSAILQLLFTSLIAFYHKSLLSMASSQLQYWPFQHSSSSSEHNNNDLSGVVALHVFGILSAHGIAVAYKLCVILYKVSKYRRLTRSGLTGENRRQGTTPRRILIVHASVGSGHKRAAQAIEEALRAQYSQETGKDGENVGKEGENVVIKVLDVVDSMEWFLKTIYKDGFMSLVTKDWGAAFVGLMFEKSNQVAPGITFGSTGFLQTLIEESFMLNFVECVFNFQPDLVVNTHFLPTKVLSHMRNSISSFEIPHVTVVTDFDVHAYWSVSPCERFFVARDECRHALEQFGVPSSRITIIGMPVVRAFSHGLPPRAACLSELQLDGSVPVILLMAGGDDVFETYEELLSMKTPVQIALVCGRYNSLKKKLENIPVPSHHKVKIEGFTKKMHYYLQSADVIITKPGGLTTAESLATGTAMAIYHSLPGQEMRNADMVLEEGAGFKISDSKMLAYKVEKVIKDKSGLERMKANARRIGNTTAADIVAEFVFQGSF
jgi:processive 1,2-diacylglycerol beta-glucosyltransferase